MRKVILFALVVSFFIFATLTRSSLASMANDQVVFTELSSTELTASLGSVNYVATDHWHWSPPSSGVAVLGSLNAYWVEPEDSTLCNVIKIGASGGFDIYSDYAISTFPNPAPQGHPDGTIIASQVGVKVTDTESIYWDAKFVDKGDASTVVPVPTTMLLLGSGLVGLVGFRKKFKK